MSTAFPQLDDNDLVARDALEVGTTATTAERGHRRVPWRFFAGRAAFYLFTLWAAITINFFVPRMMKGDAVDAFLARNRNISPEAADALRALLGLDTDKSLFQQYLDYWSHLLRGDLGVSLLHGLRPVSEVIAGALQITRPHEDGSFFPPENAVLHRNLLAAYGSEPAGSGTAGDR